MEGASPGDPSPLVALLGQALAGPRDRPAVASGARTVTLGELIDRVNVLQRALLALSGGPGQRVAVALDNRIDYVAVYLACFRTGLVVVPLHPDLDDDAAGAAGELLEPAVVIHNGQGKRVAYAAVRRAGRRPVIIRTGGGNGLDLPAYSSVPPPPDPKADAPAAVFLTSGTTGRPKGVVVTHRNWAAGVHALRAAFGDLAEDDVLLHVTPLSHTTGELILPALLAGALQRILPAGDLEEAARLLARGEATRLFAFSAMLGDLARAVAAAGRPRRLRSVLYGGAPAPLPVVEEALDALGAVLEQGFGQTETFPPTLALRREEHLLAGDAGREIRGSIGRPVGTCEVRLLGPKGVGDVPDGEPGEIAVRGDNVTPGYFGDPGATAAALRGGFFRTGDVAFRDERGYFHLLGRRAEAVERDGGTVWLRRMERAAELHPQVLEAAACTIDGLIVLAVVSRPGAASTESVGLEAFLERRLAPADRPDAVEWVGDLPRNVNMKLRRDALTQRLVARLRAGLPRQPAAVAREARR